MRRRIPQLLLLCAIPAVLLLGTTVFGDRRYAFVAAAVAVLACAAFFLRFERREQGAGRLIVVAVMAALSALGRMIFAALPGFKPVTALVILAALYLGGEAGFVTGALAAVISGFSFGQGPWTPFQMFAWGMVGLLAGALAKPLRRHRALLVLYGALSGVVFSLLMDAWTTLSVDGGWSLARYLTAVALSAQWIALYAVSNAVFLLLLAQPVGQALERVGRKFGWW